MKLLLGGGTNGYGGPGTACQRRVRVLHVYKFLYDGGTERYIHTLVTGMTPDLFEFAICCLMEPGPMAARFAADGLTVYSLGFKSGLSLPALVRNLPQLARLIILFYRYRPDVIHSHDNQPAAYARVAAWLARVPIVYVTLHNEYTWITPMQHRINQWLSRFTTRFFAVSATVARAACRADRLEESKVLIVHNGVKFPENGARKAQFQMPTDLTNRLAGKRIIGTVGSLSHRKGQDLLVRAFGRIAGDFPDSVLLIVGSERSDEPEVREGLISIANGLGVRDQLLLAGSREDVLHLLPVFELFVMPSRVEGFGLALVEAMAAGVPPIVSDIPTFLEVTDQGNCALTFRSEDSDDLAAKLSFALTHAAEMEALGSAAKEYSRRHFGIPAMISNYERQYLLDLEAANVIQRRSS